MTEITIPSLGVGMTDALLVRWLKQPGDVVEQDEPVAEIETDKTTMDLLSPSGGRLGPHLHEPGAIIAVGEVVIRVLGNQRETGAPAEPTETASAEPHPSQEPLTRRSIETAAALAGTREPHTLSPRARRLAQERASIEAATTSGSEPPITRRSGRVRELIAERVSESWRTIPHFTVTREVDAEPMQRVVADWRADGVTCTLTDVLLRALALAHRDRGTVGPVALGLAVATDDGVVIPVISDILELDAAQLAAARFGAVARARAGRLEPKDLNESPVSTLSNLGSKGIDSFTGVIALGQPSLLTVGRAVPRLHPGEDGAVAVRWTILATLNADHRVLDGADAADLLVAFADNAEAENRLGS